MVMNTCSISKIHGFHCLVIAGKCMQLWILVTINLDRWILVTIVSHDVKNISVGFPESGITVLNVRRRETTESHK